MMNSMSLSTSIQTQFYLPTNSYKNSFPSRQLSLSFRKIPLISIEKPPNAAATNGVYTPTPEETLYDLLGISQSGTLPEIKQAYKQMALKYHPDVSPPDQVHENTVRFIRVHEAYETLSDPESRAMYDCDLAKGLQLAFSMKKDGLRWKPSWEVQVEELKRRSTVGEGGRMSWGAWIRKQRAASDLGQ